MTKFVNLQQFIQYCNTVILDTNDFFLLNFLFMTGASEEDILEDAQHAIEEYYIFLQESLRTENYKAASIINQALYLELDHYKSLCVSLLGIDLSDKIDIINNHLKYEYLPHE